MGLFRFKPSPSSRMGILWTVSTIRDAALIEFGCMGHMLYSSVTLDRAGVLKGSKLYSTHISEADIAFGETSRVEKAVKEVVEKDNPKVIFFLPSSIPQIIGVDMEFLCKELEVQYPDVKMLYIPYGSFDTSHGEAIEKTLLFLAKKLSKPQPKIEKVTYNIIGSSADIYKFQADAMELVRILKNTFNMDYNCILTSDTSIEDIENLPKAHINIVIREEGLKTADYLDKKYDMPYVYGRPYGIEGTLAWIEEIGKLLDIPKNEDFIKEEVSNIRQRMKPIMPALIHGVRMHKEETTISLGGHKDVVKGIKAFAVGELGFHEGEFWCDSKYLGDEEIPYYDEEKWIKVFENHDEGILMGSGEATEFYKLNPNFQISNPDMKWRLNPNVPPFVGFNGVLELLNIWINEIDEK